MHQEYLCIYQNIKVDDHSFQYRVLNNICFLKDRLFHMGVVNTKQCTFGCNAKENYEHFFFQCRVMTLFWTRVVQYVRELTVHQVVVTYDKIVLNIVHDNNNSCINLIILIAKQLLYRWRCQKVRPVFAVFVKEVEFAKQLELQQCIIKKYSMEIYNLKWYDNIQYDETDNTIY